MHNKTAMGVMNARFRVHLARERLSSLAVFHGRDELIQSNPRQHTACRIFLWTLFFFVSVGSSPTLGKTVSLKRYFRIQPFTHLEQIK